MPTIRQIAKMCRVSPMTVSFVLNNTPGQVSEDTRERVLQVVREMGYRPRTAIRAKQEATIRTIGFAVGRSGDSFIQPGYHTFILNGVMTATERLDLNVILFHTKLLSGDPRQSIRTYLDGRCDGLIVLAPTMNQPLVSALRERGVPFVLIGDQGDGEGIASVDVDNVTEGRNAIEYLIGLGHRRIAFVGGPDFVRSACNRRIGYRQALEAKGIPYDPDLDSGPLRSEGLVYEWIIGLIRRKDIEPPTAVFCWNDTAAMRALTALEDSRKGVPGDISLMGFDDDPRILYSRPPLTSVRQPYRDIGATAVEELIARIKDQSKPGRPVYLPARIIERDSTAPLRQ
jgi:DNA-binding LacI/PurR family transcriptional regulator